jgi:hypothetical protein
MDHTSPLERPSHSLPAAVLSLLLCLGCSDDNGTTPHDSDAAPSGSGGQIGGSGGVGGSAGGSAGVGATGGNGGHQALPEEQKGELWGSWSWFWEGQNECSGQPYTGSTSISICHANDRVNVTFGGLTFPATWNGTTLQVAARTIRNEKLLDISISMTITGNEITGGTGIWTDPDAACGGTETYTGSLRSDVVWDGQLPARGGPCWLWQP